MACGQKDKVAATSRPAVPEDAARTGIAGLAERAVCLASAGTGMAGPTGGAM